MKKNVVVKKRFIISKGMLGKGITVKLTHKKGVTYK